MRNGRQYVPRFFPYRLATTHHAHNAAQGRRRLTAPCGEVAGALARRFSREVAGALARRFSREVEVAGARRFSREVEVAISPARFFSRSVQEQGLCH